VNERNEGFTLVEIMAVLVIVGLGVYLTGMLMTEAPPRYRLEAGAKKVGAILRQARTRALSSGQSLVVDVLEDGRRIRVYPRSWNPESESPRLDGAGPVGSGVGPRDVSGEGGVDHYTLPERIRIQGVVRRHLNDAEKTSTILVAPSGHFGSHVIRLTGEGDLETTVVPNPATGTVRYMNEDTSQSLVIQDNRPPPG
jgi:prepilin-type N-terminal cleavage/methylation domain-containing protein